MIVTYLQMQLEVQLTNKYSTLCTYRNILRGNWHQRADKHAATPN